MRLLGTTKQLLIDLRDWCRYHVRYNGWIWRYFTNRRSWRHWVKNRPSTHRVAQDGIDQLKRNGICTFAFNELLPAERLDDTIALGNSVVNAPSTDRLVQAAERQLRDLTSDATYYQIRLWDELDRRAQQQLVHLALSEPFLQIASGYLGLACTLAYVDLWYNVPHAGQPIGFQRWHRDSGDKKIIKLYLYLRDVNAAGGPFSYVIGSHRSDGPYGSLSPVWSSFREPVRDECIPTHDQTTCVGPAGTLFIADTTGLHKGGHVQGDPRLIFYAMYASELSRPPDEKYHYHHLLDDTSQAYSPAQRHAVSGTG